MNNIQLFCIPKQILNTLSVCMTQILLFLCLNISICFKNRSRGKNDGKFLGVLVLVQNIVISPKKLSLGRAVGKTVTSYKITNLNKFIGSVV